MPRTDKLKKGRNFSSGICKQIAGNGVKRKVSSGQIELLCNGMCVCAQAGGTHGQHSLYGVFGTLCVCSCFNPSTHTFQFKQEKGMGMCETICPC